MRQPLVVAYGMGVDSTAMLVGMAERGIRPDAILFADTGGEKDATYAFLPTMNAYLARHGFPEVTVVRYQPKDFKHWPPYGSLEENCLTNGTLPSEAFGFGSCSQKWKQAPQHTWMKAWQPALDCWAAGGKVRKAIGYDASPTDEKRACVADRTFKVAPDERYDYWYPLQEWGWNRVECARRIAAAGLPVPPKSACFFCPNATKPEIDELTSDKLRRIVVMEARALPRLTKIQGLWRNGCKGKRDPSKKKPGRMTDYIRERGLLPAEEIDRLWAEAPRELMDRNAAHADGLEIESWDEYFAGLHRAKPGCIA